MSAEELANELLVVTGGAAMAQQVMRAMSVQMRPMFPSVPEDLWNKVMGSVNDGELSGMIVPIYTKHYSRDELAALLAFYRTSLGQRLIKSTPAIMQETMAIGGAWGQRRATEILERLKEQGYKPTEI
jgi:hypothetical protein